MSFPFKEVCQLLDRLETVELHENLLPSAKPERYKELVNSWFSSHRRQINELDVLGSCALLSTLVPHWRTDRVYSLQAAGLCRILGRALGLSTARRTSLAAYTQPGAGDLATCFERVHAAGGPPATPVVTVEHVDHMLHSLAGRSSFSDPSIARLPPSSSETRDRLLSNVFCRTSPQEGKWLVRLILKDFRPVQCDETIILKSFHFLLPDLLRFQRDFTAAVTLLKNELKQYPEKPDPRSEALHRKTIADARTIRPVVGTKVSRPHFHKGRGIDSCMKMMGSKVWVLERKYDGEYCEIHVDLTKSTNPIDCITIFSKSGKNSTRDRKAILKTLVETLRLGTPDCHFKKQAILLGELVVFSDQDDCIMPFEEIRKHVSRSGVFIGTEQDSMPKAHEHLAIVFFDLLLLDEEVVMNKPINERRDWLRVAYKKIHGRAMGAEWTKVDFAQPERAKRLFLQHFAMSNAKRCEGLVLKPCDVPYFSIEAHPADYRHSYIKLKKDYISDMGDEEDFAVVGASYNAQQAATAGGKAFIKWTTFHLGCLTNKEDVRKYDARPIFKHVGTIDQQHCIPQAILETANILGNLRASPWTESEPPQNFDLEVTRSSKMSVVFDKPLVFEVLGAGYEKPSSCDYLMLRHPRVKKLHEDRDWADCVTFQELQKKGRASRAATVDSESQEMQRWIDKLERCCRRKVELDRRSTPSRSTVSPTKKTFATPEISELRSSPLVTNPSNIPSPAITGHSPNICLINANGKRNRGPVASVAETGASALRTSKRSCPELRQWDMQERNMRATSVPLGEITNTANAATMALDLANFPDGSRALSENSRKLVGPVHPTTLIHCQHSQTSQADLERSRGRCGRSSQCPFNNAVVYFAPCIAHTPYISENLLGAHNAIPTAELIYWDRDAFSRPNLTHVVSESQSYEGMRKIVLVEGRRKRKTRELLALISSLNGGSLRERIDIYDWRVLEVCEGHDRGAETLKKHFIGATLFDDTRKRALFVGEREWNGIL